LDREAEGILWQRRR